MDGKGRKTRNSELVVGDSDDEVDKRRRHAAGMWDAGDDQLMHGNLRARIGDAYRALLMGVDGGGERA